MSPYLYLGDAATSRARAWLNASSSTSNVRPTAPSLLLFLWTHESAILSICGCFVLMASLLLNHLWNSSRSSFPSPLSSNLFIILFTWATYEQIFTPCPNVHGRKIHFVNCRLGHILLANCKSLRDVALRMNNRNKKELLKLMTYGKSLQQITFTWVGVIALFIIMNSFFVMNPSLSLSSACKTWKWINQ